MHKYASFGTSILYLSEHSRPQPGGCFQLEHSLTCLGAGVTGNL
jgi:hypothetical protein